MSVFYCTYIRSSTLSRLPHASALSRFINIDEDMLYIYIMKIMTKLRKDRD